MKKIPEIINRIENLLNENVETEKIKKALFNIVPYLHVITESDNSILIYLGFTKDGDGEWSNKPSENGYESIIFKFYYDVDSRFVNKSDKFTNSFIGQKYLKNRKLPKFKKMNLNVVIKMLVDFVLYVNKELKFDKKLMGDKISFEQ